METPHYPHDLVLGLHPSTRGLGHALFEGPTEPIDWGVAEAKGSSKNRTSLSKVESLVDFYQPTVLILEDHTAEGTRRSRRVIELYEAITGFAKARSLTLTRYTHAQVEDIFEMFGAKTKYAIARKIGEWLPQFEVRLTRCDVVWTRHYHGRDQRWGRPSRRPLGASVRACHRQPAPRGRCPGCEPKPHPGR